MMGETRGFTAHIKAFAPECNNRHCTIHRYSFVVKKEDSVWIVGCSSEDCKLHTVKTILTQEFSVSSDEMDSSHTTLLLHTEVRWLSRGKVLVQAFTMRSEMISFC
jgi:hypothetical protein